MRQLLLANTVTTQGLLNEAVEGSFGLVKIPHTLGKNPDESGGEGGDEYAGISFVSNVGVGVGEPTHDYSGNGWQSKNALNFVLVRSSEHGGNVFIPFHQNHYEYVRLDYRAKSKFVGYILVNPVESDWGDYTIIAVKKGKKFNERNKWTASVHIGRNTTTERVATQLAKYFNDNYDGLGLRATVISSDGEEDFPFDTEGEEIMYAIKFVGANDEDYRLIGADNLTDASITYESRGRKAVADFEYIKDLADKAAADAGFEYTYEDDVKALYPNYHLNPSLIPVSSEDEGEEEESGFTVFTLRWAEPRYMKTRDEVVHQILQIVIPSNNADDLESLLNMEI